MELPTFTYTKGNLPCDGVFAFTFYRREWPSNDYIDTLERDPYIKGLGIYLDMITSENSPFSRWKMILYSDEATYALASKYPLFLSEKVEFVLVSWPYYTKMETPTQINDDILRVMRFRAFFDFPKVPVFVRDADTIFAINDFYTLQKSLATYSDEVLTWETNYLEGAKKYPNTFIFGTSIGYKEFWHKNARTAAEAPLGALAGLQSTMPIVPCFQNESLWEECLRYIRGISIRKEVNSKVTFSNEDSSLKIGKDEQILLFILRPACNKNIFYFDLDIKFQRIYTTKMRRYFNRDYPTIIFNRGSNTVLEELFSDNIININALKQSALNTEKKIAESLKSKIKEEMKELDQRVIKHGRDTDTFLISLFSLKDPYLTKTIASYREKLDDIAALKSKLENKYLRNGNTAEIETLKNKLMHELDKRDALLKEIETVSLELKKKSQSAGTRTRTRTRKRKSYKKVHLKTLKNK
jgi:hypothetical protein